MAKQATTGKKANQVREDIINAPIKHPPIPDHQNVVVAESQAITGMKVDQVWEGTIPVQGKQNMILGKNAADVVNQVTTGMKVDRVWVGIISVQGNHRRHMTPHRNVVIVVNQATIGMKVDQVWVITNVKSCLVGITLY